MTFQKLEKWGYLFCTLNDVIQKNKFPNSSFYNYPCIFIDLAPQKINFLLKILFV